MNFLRGRRAKPDSMTAPRASEVTSKCKQKILPSGLVENSSHVAKRAAKGGTSPQTKMNKNNTELLERKFWTWGIDQNLWDPFLAEVRAKVSLAARKVKSTQAMAKEINNPTNILEDVV